MGFLTRLVLFVAIALVQVAPVAQAARKPSKSPSECAKLLGGGRITEGLELALDGNPSDQITVHFLLQTTVPTALTMAAVKAAALGLEAKTDVAYSYSDLGVGFVSVSGPVALIKQLMNAVHEYTNALWAGLTRSRAIAERNRNAVTAEVDPLLEQQIANGSTQIRAAILLPQDVQEDIRNRFVAGAVDGETRSERVERRKALSREAYGPIIAILDEARASDSSVSYELTYSNDMLILTAPAAVMDRVVHHPIVGNAVAEREYQLIGAHRVAPPRTAPAELSEAPTPTDDQVREAKNALIDALRLLGINHVGIGIGIGGVIRVNVSTQSDADAVPQTMNGVPVQVRVMGPVRPQ